LQSHLQFRDCQVAFLKLNNLVGCHWNTQEIQEQFTYPNAIDFHRKTKHETTTPPHEEWVPESLKKPNERFVAFD